MPVDTRATAAPPVCRVPNGRRPMSYRQISRMPAYVPAGAGYNENNEGRVSMAIGGICRTRRDWRGFAMGASRRFSLGITDATPFTQYALTVHCLAFDRNESRRNVWILDASDRASQSPDDACRDQPQPSRSTRIRSYGTGKSRSGDRIVLRRGNVLLCNERGDMDEARTDATRHGRCPRRACDQPDREAGAGAPCGTDACGDAFGAGGPPGGRFGGARRRERVDPGSLSRAGQCQKAWQMTAMR